MLSPGNLLEMQFLRPQTKLVESEFHFNKILRWIVSTFKFEKNWFRVRTIWQVEEVDKSF